MRKMNLLLIAGFFFSILIMDSAHALYIRLDEDIVQPGAPRTAVISIEFGNTNTLGNNARRSSIPGMMHTINAILNVYPLNNALNPRIRMIEFHNVMTRPSERRSKGCLMHLNNNHGDMLQIGNNNNMATNIRVLNPINIPFQTQLINLRDSL